MAIEFGPPPPAPPAWPLEELRAIPTTIMADELGRRSTIDPAIRPIGPAPATVGPALTIECVAGDISGVLYGLELVQPGQVVVVDARGHAGTAIWGEIMQTWAIRRGAAAVVIDGAVRDTGVLRQSALPIYARAVSPRGPQSVVAGSVNRPVACGGVAVDPGDLIVADEDGVLVVRPDEVDDLVRRCQARIAFEQEVIRGVLAGGSARELLGLPAQPAAG